nr:MAG TPA: hypothetical protein [Caudoviricetes sp.]
MNGHDFFYLLSVDKPNVHHALLCEVCKKAV